MQINYLYVRIYRLSKAILPKICVFSSRLKKSFYFNSVLIKGEERHRPGARGSEPYRLKKGLGLPTTPAAPAIQNFANIIPCEKTPKSGRHVWHTSYSIATERKTCEFRPNPSKQVTAHIYWWREVSAVIKWGKLHSFEHRNQTRITVQSTGHHSSTIMVVRSKACGTVTIAGGDRRSAQNFGSIT